jgi:hypothetical protein
MICNAMTTVLKEPDRLKRSGLRRPLASLLLLSYFVIGSIAYVPEWHNAICHHCCESDDPCSEHSSKPGDGSPVDDSCLFCHVAQGHFLHSSAFVFPVFEEPHYETIQWICPVSVDLDRIPHRWPPIAAPPGREGSVGIGIASIFTFA